MKHLNNWKMFEYWDPNEAPDPDPSWEEEMHDLVGDYKDLMDIMDVLINDEIKYNKEKKKTVVKAEETDAYYYKKILDKHINRLFPNKSTIGVYGKETSQFHELSRFLNSAYPDSWTDSNENEPIYYEISEASTPLLKIMHTYAEEFECEDCTQDEHGNKNDWDTVMPDFAIIDDKNVYNKYNKYFRYLSPHVMDLFLKNQINEETANSLSVIWRTLFNKSTTTLQLDQIVKLVEQDNIDEETMKNLSDLVGDDDAELLILLLDDDDIKNASKEEIKTMFNAIKAFKGGGDPL